HTGPDVHPNMTATAAQCSAWYRADMTAKMKAVLAVSPELAGNRNALMAAGDLAYNSGAGKWPGSPMRAAFAKGQWAAGCQAFAGYMTGYKAPKPVPGRRCWISKLNGKLYCELPGLVVRRKGERDLCLGLPA
ncbi:MAG TPA: glycoside hydrolase family protein, partial [Acetobacteraceae bacterium]|nr:glycoside hydrolase family protein [Acetobacteraceae bacterium]